MKPTNDKTTKVTLDRLMRRDHYRVQMQMRNPLTWAVCYGILRDFNATHAAMLRDKYADAMERSIYEDFQQLWGQEQFVQFAADWIERNVEQACQDGVRHFMNATVGCRLPAPGQRAVFRCRNRHRRRSQIERDVTNYEPGTV
jgi:hypothetical protein